MNIMIREGYRLTSCLRNNRGFSLLEVLMALVVVFLALLGFAGYSVVAHTGITANRDDSRAILWFLNLV